MLPRRRPPFEPDLPLLDPLIRREKLNASIKLVVALLLQRLELWLRDWRKPPVDVRILPPKLRVLICEPLKPRLRAGRRRLVKT